MVAPRAHSIGNFGVFWLLSLLNLLISSVSSTTTYKEVQLDRIPITIFSSYALHLLTAYLIFGMLLPWLVPDLGRYQILGCLIESLTWGGPAIASITGFNIEGLKCALMSMLLGLDAHPTTGSKPYNYSNSKEDF